MQTTNKKIFFVPGARGFELQNFLAANEHPVFNGQTVNATELAKMLYLRSGKIPPTNVISENESLAIFAKILLSQKISYFKTASFFDAQNLKRAVDLVRKYGVDAKQNFSNPANANNSNCSLVASETVAFDALNDNPEFPDKNKALQKAFELYCKELNTQNVIDNIQFIKGAIDAFVRADVKQNNTTQIITIQQFNLCALDDLLVSAMAQSCQLKTVSLDDFAKPHACEECDNAKEQKNKTIFTKAYGASNEVLNVFDNIAKSKKPLDINWLAITNTKLYSNLIFEICMRHNIPVTFGCGVPITLSDAAKLFVEVYAWMTEDNFGPHLLHNLVFSKNFDTSKLQELLQIEDVQLLMDVVEMAGNLRLSFDKQDNAKKMQQYKQSNFAFPVRSESGEDNSKIFEYTQQFESLFLTTPEDILQNYTLTCFDGKEAWQTELKVAIESSSKALICQTIAMYRDITGNWDFGEIVSDIMGKQVAAQSPQPGYVHVDSIKSTLLNTRKNLYLLGLSADKFPGSPRENYLLLDNDMSSLQKHFNLDKVPTSDNLIADKNQMLNHVYNLAVSQHKNIFVSWPCFNSADLKSLNPSSSVFQMYKANAKSQSLDFDDFNKSIPTIGYFEVADGPLFKPSFDFIQGNIVSADSSVQDKQATAVLQQTSSQIKARFSPTAIGNYLGCPFAFYLCNVLKLDQSEDDNTVQILNPLERGSLLHECMETITNQSRPTCEEFVSYGLNLSNQFIVYKQPVRPEEVEDELQDFKDLLTAAWQQNEKFAQSIVANEKWLNADVDIDSMPFSLYGKVDRIEKDERGNLSVIDFKTSMRLKHEPNDPASMVQGLLYAYLLSHGNNGSNVTNVEFRYPRKFNPKFPARNLSAPNCAPDNAYVEEVLCQLAKDCKSVELNKAVADIENDKDCKYCKYKTVCQYEKFVEPPDDAEVVCSGCAEDSEVLKNTGEEQAGE